MKRRALDWKECASKLAETFPRERLYPAVVAWADQRSRRGSWAIALSGGADSLALLLIVWALWPAQRRRLVVLHFNHRLRGRESDADEKFCARVCRSLGVKLVRGSWTVGRILRLPRRGGGLRARPPPTVSEAEARAARLAFFETHSRVLWLGHQEDDIAETMLMRLARGSGSGGLSAPRPMQVMPRRRVHLRPLLTVKKREVIAALRAAGATWREDSSNALGDFFRNRIRKAVLPAWAKAAKRDALAGAARSRELLAEDDVALEARLDELHVFGPGRTLAVAKLAGQLRAIVRRALHRWLLAQPRAGDLARQGFDSLLAAVERGQPTRHSLGREGFALIRGGWLRFERVGKRR